MNWNITAGRPVYVQLVEQLELALVAGEFPPGSRIPPVRELAARAYLSEAHFIRKFRRETGYTPHQYLNRVRVARAGWLLRFTDRTVAQVARDVGFRQSSRFIQLYKAITGRTPGQERG